MGTAELACPSLEALATDARFAVQAVVTQPDKPRGRDLKTQSTPVKKVALAHNLPVLQPERSRAESFISQLRELRPDLIVVAAYGQILSQSLLDVPPYGCVNVHASLLPKYRGAAPIQWAILNGDSETGVTIMKMDAGLDTGDILSESRIPIADTDNAQALHDRLAKLGAELLVRTVPDYVEARVTPRPQSARGEAPGYARKISKEDGRIDWTKPARAIWNQVRAFVPWPTAYTWLPSASPERRALSSPQSPSTPRLLKIWNASVQEHAWKTPGEILEAGKFGIVVACGEHALRILELQLEGARRLSAQQFLAGHPLKPGDRLLSAPL
jgi:methionyl-tRNA formyltransferase